MDPESCRPAHMYFPCRFGGGGLAGVYAAGSDPCGGHDAGLGPAGGGFPAAHRPEECRGSPHCRPQRAVHGRLHRAVQLCEESARRHTENTYMRCGQIEQVGELIGSTFVFYYSLTA